VKSMHVHSPKQLFSLTHLLGVNYIYMALFYSRPATNQATGPEPKWTRKTIKPYGESKIENKNVWGSYTRTLLFLCVFVWKTCCLIKVAFVNGNKRKRPCLGFSKGISSFFFINLIYLSETCEMSVYVFRLVYTTIPFSLWWRHPHSFELLIS
jgi:hypothetical protein